MQIFDITVPAYSPFVVHAPGRYIKYLAGSNGGGDATLVITPGGQGGSKITLAPGQAYRIGAQAKAPDSWTLSNYANGAAIVGKVVIGDGQIDDPTIAGTVQVVDGGKFRTLANTAFMGAAHANGAASNLAVVQLWNLANSGKRVVIEAVGMQSQLGASQVGFGISPVQLGGGAGPITAAPKRSDGTVSTAVQLYAITQAATGVLGAQLGVIGVAQSLTTEKKFNEPVVLLPGYGLNAWNGTGPNDLWVTFEWYEEPNV